MNKDYDDKYNIVGTSASYQNWEITKLTQSARAFEIFALNILRDYLDDQGKRMLLYEEGDYDAILPDGIDDIDVSVGVEVKLRMSNKEPAHVMNRYLSKLLSSNVDKLLLIFGDSFNKNIEDKIYFKNSIEDRIIVWSINELKYKAGKYFEKYKYMIEEPNKTIVEEVINLTSQKENKRTEEKSILLETLKSNYVKDNLVLFLGAGISIDAGIPLWNEMIRKLFVEMINSKLKATSKKITKKVINTLVKFAYDNNEASPLTQMRYIRSAFEPSEYNSLVRKIIYLNKPNIDTKLLVAIAKICTPQRNNIGIKGIITYNFDDLVERCLLKKDIEINNIHCDDDIAFLNKLNIYHVHGYMPHDVIDKVDDYSNLVFSEEDYHKVYRDAYCWSNITQLNFLRENVCLFIGCSLTDPNLRRLLDVATRSDESPRHFAILKKKGNIDLSEMSPSDYNTIEQYRSIDDNIRESYFSSLGLNIIWIDDYNEIPEILIELRK